VDDADDPAIPDEPPRPEHISGALMLSFGPVHLGRERLAVDTFTEISRFLGALLADEAITEFAPYFFADGQHGGMIGFFLVQGDRARLDEVRRDPAFQRLLLRTGAATSNVGVHTLVAGTEAGRLVNDFRDIRRELGLL
jgi:hypothetical protein